MGGSDDPSNIVLLTIEEHAEAHRVLYKQYGNQKDKIAWLGLSGLIPRADVMKELHKLGRRLADEKILNKYGVINPGQLEHNRKLLSERNSKFHKEGRIKAPDWTGKKHKQESKDKIGLKNSVHQKGQKNSQYGTCWITNGQENKKIKKENLDIWISKGYYKGRIAGLV